MRDCRARPPTPSQPDWYSKEQRGGTDLETLALALLVARWLDDDGCDTRVRKWRDAVISDAPSYTDGALWRAPESWHLSRRMVPAAFTPLVRSTTRPERRGIMLALTIQHQLNLAPLDVAPKETELTKYIELLLVDPKKGNPLLGAGDEPSLGGGAVRRSTYLQPRVARLVLERPIELQRLLAEGIAAAVEASSAEGTARVPGAVGKSPNKPELKEMVADNATTIEAAGIALERAKQSRAQAVRRAAAPRDAIRKRERARAEAQATAATSAAAAAAEHAHAGLESERDKAVAERDAARALARESNKEVAVVRADVRRLKRKRSDPSRLRALEQALARERKDNHALRVELENYKDKVALLHAKIDELRATIEDNGSVQLPRRCRGKGAGRGMPHSTQLTRLYQELLALNVFPSRVNACIVKVSWQ